MTKTARLILVMVMAFSALLLLPAVALAAPAKDSAQSTKTVSFAFTALITSGVGKDVPITGGLTLNVKANGYFNGNLHEPDGTWVSTSGRIKSNGDLSITFYNVKGMPLIKGQGKPVNGEYTGPFQVYSAGAWVASGIWAALPVNPWQTLALAFTGVVTSGNDKGLELTGALIFNKDTLQGSFLEPNGKVLGVSAMLQNGGKDISVNFGNGAILGTGKLVDNPLNGLDKGYAGPFSITGTNDKGSWTAFIFKF